MSDISIRDYKIDNLQMNYIAYSNHLFNFQLHIDRCLNEFIISINERHNYIKIINDILRQMNIVYNTQMMEIYESENDNSKNMSISEIIPTSNTELTTSDIRSLVNLHKAIGTNWSNKFNEPFLEINQDILSKLGVKIGFYNIIHALSLIIGEEYDTIYDKKIINEIKAYNHIFIPLKFSIEKTERPEGIIYFKKTIINKDVLIENCANFYVKRYGYKNEYIVLTGYFNHDPLNIIVRTTQICNGYVYQKKKEIESHISNVKDMNDKFIKSYIKNSSMCDIITHTKEEYLDQLSKHQKMYNRLTRLSFTNLMKEFVKDDSLANKIRNMFIIIKLLLLGSDESANVAGLLFGISKEKKPQMECSISDIIYKNLSYTSQIKLKKTSINIKNELDKIKTITIDNVDLKKQIVVCRNMPDNVKKMALDKIEELNSSNNEYYKQLLYVRTLLNYPWPAEADDKFFAEIGRSKEKSIQFLDGVIETLDKKVYGHLNCKESIKELLGKWIKNPSSPGTALGFSGPPGVGKTLIAKAIGEALHIPFVQITLGGQNDGDLLHGHGYTYSGSQPGMIIRKMIEAGSARCIVYFDELDKACKKHDSNEIYSILIHITDPNTNTEFQDRFFQEIKFPLDKVLFIFSYNDSTKIDPILMDRITDIPVKSFTLSDKKNIAQDFLVGEISESVGFCKNDVVFDDECTEYIISRYTKEHGVRELRRKLEKIYLKLNIDRIYGINIFENKPEGEPVKITKQLIQKYLQTENSQDEYITHMYT